MQAASPRIQARLLLHNQPNLVMAVRHLTLSCERVFDRRTSLFLADICELLSRLEPKPDDICTSENIPSQSLSQLIQILGDMEDWLKGCTESKMQTVRADQISPLAAKLHPAWSLPIRWSRMLVMENSWAARNLILFHMGKIKVLDTLMGYSTQQHDIDGMFEYPTKPVLVSSEQWICDGLHNSSRTIFDLVPYVIGLIDKSGKMNMSLSLHDLGLLVIQYPLWMLQQATFVPSDAKTDATTLLAYFRRQRSLS